MNKLLAFGATLIVAGSSAIALGAAGAASAQTTECVNAASGSCGAQVNVYDDAWTVVTPAYNGRVTASPLNTTDGSQDFIANQTTSNVNERTFNFAPGNTPSQFCLSNTSGKTVVLRPCSSTSRFQRWDGVNTLNTTSTTWTNEASGLKVTANGTGNAIIAVKTPHAKSAGWNFQSAAS